MSVDAKSRQFARGEVRSKIQWGAEPEEAIELLQVKYQITGAEADQLVGEALDLRRALVRKKAGIKLGFAAAGLAVAVTYFVIQRSSGMIFQIGARNGLMWSLGITCLVVGVKSAAQMITGEATGSVQ